MQLQILLWTLLPFLPIALSNVHRRSASPESEVADQGSVPSAGGKAPLAAESWTMKLHWTIQQDAPPPPETAENATADSDSPEHKMVIDGNMRMHDEPVNATAEEEMPAEGENGSPSVTTDQADATTEMPVTDENQGNNATSPEVAVVPVVVPSSDQQQESSPSTEGSSTGPENQSTDQPAADQSSTTVPPMGQQPESSSPTEGQGPTADQYTEKPADAYQSSAAPATTGEPGAGAVVIGPYGEQPAAGGENATSGSEAPPAAGETSSSPNAEEATTEVNNPSTEQPPMEASTTSEGVAEEANATTGGEQPIDQSANESSGATSEGPSGGATESPSQPPTDQESTVATEEGSGATPEGGQEGMGSTSEVPPTGEQGQNATAQPLQSNGAGQSYYSVLFVFIAFATIFTEHIYGLKI